MNKGKTFWLIVIILIIASFFRLYQIKTMPPGLYPDEAMNGNNALEALRTGQFKVFYPENNGREGFFINTQALFLKFFGANSPSQISQGETWEGKPWILRLPSAIFGILTVLGIYLLAAELFSSEAGLLSAFLLATTFWHINFSRIGFRAILAPFFLIFALYFLIKSIRSKKPPRSFILAILGGIFYGFGFYTYIAYRITPLLLLLFPFFFPRDKKFWRAVAVFLFFTFITALPIGIYFLKNPADFFGRTSQVSIFNSGTPLKDLGLNILKTAAMFNIRGDSNWRHNYSSWPELFWPVGILFVIGIIIGVKKLREKQKLNHQNSEPDKNEPRREKFAYLVSFLWLVLAAVPAVISNESLPHALRSILMIPPTIIFSAAGGLWLYKFLKKRSTVGIAKLLSFAFLLTLAAATYITYFVLWANNPNTADAFSQNYVTLSKEISGLPTNIPKYVVVNATGVLVRSIPMPAQTVMFITDTYEPSAQQAKKIFYVLPQNENIIPAEAIRVYLQ